MVNKKVCKKFVDEYLKGQRYWILDGSFHKRQGFWLRLCGDEVAKMITEDGKGTITRKVTLGEVIELRNHKHLINKEAVEFMLKLIDEAGVKVLGDSVVEYATTDEVAEISKRLLAKNDELYRRFVESGD